jgi:hypothetical protein
MSGFHIRVKGAQKFENLKNLADIAITHRIIDSENPWFQILTWPSVLAKLTPFLSHTHRILRHGPLRRRPMALLAIRWVPAIRLGVRWIRRTPAMLLGDVVRTLHPFGGPVMYTLEHTVVASTCQTVNRDTNEQQEEKPSATNVGSLCCHRVNSWMDVPGNGRKREVNIWSWLESSQNCLVSDIVKWRLYRDKSEKKNEISIKKIK